MDENENDCCICYLCLHPNDNYCLLTCHHSFHSSCILKWSQIHNSCPLCKSILYEEKEETEKAVMRYFILYMNINNRITIQV